jgi:hypothetical protein
LYDRCSGVLRKHRLPPVHVVTENPIDFRDAALSYPAPTTFQASDQSGTDTQAVGKLYLRQAQSAAQAAQIFRRHIVNCTIFPRQKGSLSSL